MLDVWSIAYNGSEYWTLRKLERKYLENFEMWLLEENKEEKVVRESN